MFYGITPSGDILFKSDLNSKIVGVPIMDKTGVIYVTSDDDTIYALGAQDLLDSDLSVEVSDNSFGDNIIVKISLNNQTTGNISIIVDNIADNVVVNGNVIFKSFSELKSGFYQVIVSYSGDLRFSSSSKVVNFTIKGNPQIDINLSDDSSVYIKLPSDATGSLIVSIDGVNCTKNLVDGKATFDISYLCKGPHNITVSYSGDSKYSPISKTSVVVKGSANLTDGNATQPVPDEAFTIPESGSDYSISLPSDATGTLTVNVDGVPYTQTLVNGKATVSIPELSEGSHNITVTYSGDNKYAQITKSSVVVKEHVPVIKLTASNLSMLYTAGKYFKVRLTSDGNALPNQKVKITINGKTYTKTTDKSGYASLKISLPPKAYTVKATYGNLTITKKVTVKSIIQEKNINAKKSSKSIKIKVTLKKVNKKYLKNKKVTLKFNKKTFKAKTNKKGVVTFTIKKNVYNKLKANKKYTYQVIYAKDKVKKTIKFKK